MLTITQSNLTTFTLPQMLRNPTLEQTVHEHNKILYDAQQQSHRQKDKATENTSHYF